MNAVGSSIASTAGSGGVILTNPGAPTNILNVSTITNAS